jgi:hypothetical protein
MTLPSTSVPIRTAHEALNELQVWDGPGGIFFAGKRGDDWFLFHKRWPVTGEYLVKADGSLWSGIHHDKRVRANLDAFVPTGEVVTQCGNCGYASLTGEDRHRKTRPRCPKAATPAESA